MPDGDPAEVAVARETIRLAFVAALQHLPPRQRAVLDPLRGAALAGDRGRRAARHERRLGQQRAAARPGDARGGRASAPTRPRAELDEADRELLARYVEAFERYDIDALTSLIQEDATQSMPPFDLWLRGRDDILTWWFGPGHRLPRLARRSRRVARTARRRSGSTSRARGGGYEPWALQVLEIVRRPDRRVHVLPRHRHAVPALRPAAPPRRVARSRQPADAKRDQLEQLVARRCAPAPSSHARAAAARALDARRPARCGRRTRDSASRERERSQSPTSQRSSPDRDATSRRWLIYGLDRRRGGNSSASATDEFSRRARSNLSRPTDRKDDADDPGQPHTAGSRSIVLCLGT